MLIYFSPTQSQNLQFFMQKIDTLLLSMQIILDQLKFDINLCQYFIHFLSPLPRLEKTLKGMSHGGLYTSPTPLFCDKFIIFSEEHFTMFHIHWRTK